MYFGLGLFSFPHFSKQFRFFCFFFLKILLKFEILIAKILTFFTYKEDKMSYSVNGKKRRDWNLLPKHGELIMGKFTTLWRFYHSKFHIFFSWLFLDLFLPMKSPLTVRYFPNEEKFLGCDLYEFLMTNKVSIIFIFNSIYRE